MNRRELLKAALGGMLAAAVPAGRALTGELDPWANKPVGAFQPGAGLRKMRRIMKWARVKREQSNDAIAL